MTIWNKKRAGYAIFALLLATSCSDRPWNDPYPNDSPRANTFYTSFSERPKHLDPAVSYSSNEWVIINQIYETPLQYHYLKRPYELEPLLATQMPTVSYLDKNKKPIQEKNPTPQNIGYTVYTITIKPGIFYHPHPCFAQENGKYLYHALSMSDARSKDELSDFSQTSTREVVAEDFVFQIKRLADPLVESPILGLMQEHIVGLGDYSKKLQKQFEALGATYEHPQFFNLNKLDLEGAQVLSKYTYTITIKGLYPQFIYWLAMPFFAPMPWEAEKFYEQAFLVEKDITLDWYPVGTGPFYLEKNDPNSQMVLAKNPLFRGGFYPNYGEANDAQNGYLALAGQPIPFLDKVEFSLEKEDIPYWNKFLQGYYDSSGISSDSFDQAFQSTNNAGGLRLTEPMLAKKIHLNTDILPATHYWGFNMLDEVVGGFDEKKQKLRQAISIALDMEEYINIFLNGRAVSAMSLLPPGIAIDGVKAEEFNPYVYEKDPSVKEGVRRKSLSDAKKLLSEAGYPDGVDPKTQQPLILYYDAVQGAGPDTKAQFDWIRKEFSKLGIELVVRATQYNRFQDKMRSGDTQIFSWAWNADYPDPENFLFLLYGPNSKVKSGGENPGNYSNPEFDRLFEKMRALPNGEERRKVIQQMLSIAQKDAPWIWGFHPKSYSLSHQWVYPVKPNAMSHNDIKYIKVDPILREKKRVEWNRAVFWPIGVIFIFFGVLTIPAVVTYLQKIHRKFKRYQLW